ncbi:putative secreted protein (Por secretion system target) [Aquimarina sp. MAR_2010_214]|uniref:M43 family zinc metalloprotease n=1 Tax=Aquimarina sp. MAR_2010_214 TaxID=1250026 RepID=UPI000C703D8D|nr:M43 family zinc metalloprotease [Aquimarina sp. MAR_2010_214]PKV48229.1 putative secreted protein (Por secretion system target) [Aquimarina sp. MAR_2010_214]
MKTKTIILTAMLFLYVPFLFSQQENDDTPLRCSFEDALKSTLVKYPQEIAVQKAFNKVARAEERRNKGATSKAAATYTIPVVFHVYGKVQSGKTVTYDKIKRAVEVVNEDFNGQNPDFNTVDPFFKDRRGTLNIEFALAKIDPNGGSTSGVVFHEEEKGFGDVGYDDKIATYAWDNYKYMNVYIMNDLKNDGKLNRSGVAWFPMTSMSNAGTARVVYNGRYLHGNTDTEFASILSHEFGHWLNLHHTFNGTGCDDPNGDFVNDTPTEDTNATNLGCTVGATECGNLINYENYMGYESSGGCAKMFTAGQISRMNTALDHAARRPLWQQSNLTATGVKLTGASLVTDDSTVEESDTNNGTLADTTYDIDMQNGTFALSSGSMNQGTHFSASLPQGLSAAITVVNNTKIRVKFNGQVSNHALANNTVGTITFTNAAINGGTSTLNSNKVSYNFSFFDPYKIVYVNIPDETATASAVWQPFTIIAGGASNRYGAFYENNNLRLETYAKALVCQSGTRNVTLIQANQLISDNSNWVNSKPHPDLHDVETSTYTTWRGKTAYVGFQLAMYGGRVNYGWMKVKVNSAGTELSVLEYAYTTKPNGPIKAGSTTLEPDTPTCNDGIQNGDETGIDCGGSCDPCPTSVYCEDKSTRTSGEYISKVELGTINNTTTRSTNGYGDHTSVSTNLAQNTSATITITPNSANTYKEAYGVWIDYNNDGDFTDSGERVFTKTPTTDKVITGTFTVPSTAKAGSTRMRIIMEYFNNTTSLPEICKTNHNYGETEDYTVNITGGSGPSCNDGIQNGDETGVDCGGSCTPCATNDGVVYVNNEDIAVSSSSTWNFFRIEVGDDNGFGAWFSNNSVRLVTYNKDVVCEGTSRNVTMLSEGVEVGTANNFVAESNSYVVSSSSYSNWNGKSGYIGFTFKISGNTHYGWFYATVANDGLSYSILDYAYNTNAGQGLTTKRPAAAGPEKAENLVKVYPNSFTETTNIDLTKLGKERFTMSVYDLLGRRIYHKNYDRNPGVLPFGGAITEKGNYFVKITSKGTSEIHTIVKK